VTSRSPELDEVRRLLFPRLSVADGWAKIDRAFQGAADPRKREAIELIARSEQQKPLR